jgi:predicted RNA-binding protein YlqC (UPF0109 family)
VFSLDHRALLFASSDERVQTLLDRSTALKSDAGSGVSIMEHSKDITDVITSLIKLMVDRPEGVAVECVSLDEGSCLRISVDPTDIGKVIGKQGRTARSLRVLVAAMGMAAKQRIGLDIRQ